MLITNPWTPKVVPGEKPSTHRRPNAGHVVQPEVSIPPSLGELRSQGQAWGPKIGEMGSFQLPVASAPQPLFRLGQADLPYLGIYPWLTEDDTISSLFVSLNPSLEFVSNYRTPPTSWMLSPTISYAKVLFPKLESFTTSMIFAIII